MAEVWEAHSLNKQNLTELTMHQFEAYKNELIKASSTMPTATASPDASNKTTTPHGATVVSRKPIIKREHPPATMVTPMSSAKRHQSFPPGTITSSAVDLVATDSSKSQSPVLTRSDLSTAMKTATNDIKPLVLPKYEERAKVGCVVVSYRPNGNTNFTRSGRRRCVVTTKKESATTNAGNGEIGTNDDYHGKTKDVTRFNITKPFRHMFSTMADRSTALERGLAERKEAIAKDIEKNTAKIKENKNDNEETMAPFEEVNVPRQDPSTFIGRVCNEAHQGRLNATSIVLEGSRASCGGARVNVDMTKMQQQNSQKRKTMEYSLFPGQIVAVEGMNGTGRKITATKVKEGATHVSPVLTSVRTMKNYYYGNHNALSGDSKEQPASLKIISACGPFTTSHDMDYAPFIDLLNKVLEEKPDVVILTGPFVDTRQKAVQSGRLTIDVEREDGNIDEIVASYEAVFADKITAVIEETLTESETDFVLVPSLEDATATCVYPQHPFQDRLPKGGRVLNIPGADGLEFGSLGLHGLNKHYRNGTPRVHCLSNPCTFRINELVFGVTSTDVLFHMSVEETNAHLPPGSRLRRIAQHLVNQQSYYPLFPPNKSVNLDLKQQDGWKMPCKPDVLILPSKLAPFCSPILGSTVVINPGHLTKGTTGGTYATMEINPVALDELEGHGNDDVIVPHNVQDRMQVDVKRI